MSEKDQYRLYKPSDVSVAESSARFLRQFNNFLVPEYLAALEEGKVPGKDASVTAKEPIFVGFNKSADGELFITEPVTGTEPKNGVLVVEDIMYRGSSGRLKRKRAVTLNINRIDDKQKDPLGIRLISHDYRDWDFEEQFTYLASRRHFFVLLPKWRLIVPDSENKDQIIAERFELFTRYLSIGRRRDDDGDNDDISPDPTPSSPVLVHA